ncbi:MAG: sigma-70 family RNA polymerase sigma factor [Alphaproteobacteria bacterium]|nr:sigma-70 family RNA polymerase sigma factor [Alphaproteobacteria bacterium]
MSAVADERALVAAWAAGDRTAGREVVAAHYDAIVRFFRTKAGPDADDLVQRTFLRCHEKAATFEGTGTFRAFVFAIARFVLLEHIRGRVRDGRNEPDFNASSIAALQPGVWTQAVARKEKRDLVAALQMIPVESQILLELFYWEELSVAELGEALGIPAGTVKSRLFRAREQLQDAIEKVPVQDGDRRSAQHLLDSWRMRIRRRQDDADPAR